MARFQTKNKKMEFSTKGGGSEWVDFPLRKKYKIKCKDDQNGPTPPENSRLKFVLLGGSDQIFGLIVRLYFNLIFFSFYGHIF